MTSDQYPSHIFENIRIEIAKSIIHHEFKKLFSSLTDQEVEKLKIDIDSWIDNDSNYQLSGVRDFWNGFDGIMMGFKLKNIVPLITAENIKWHKQVLKTDNIKLGIAFPDLGKNTRYRLGKDLKLFFKKNPTVQRQLANIANQHFQKGPKREKDPIIVIKKTDETFVHDGNGRLLRSIVLDKEKINSYVGTMNDNEPKNYWIPTGLLMQLVRQAQIAYENKIDYSDVTSTLIKIIKESQSAVYEFKERAIDPSNKFQIKFREEVLFRL